MSEHVHAYERERPIRRSLTLAISATIVASALVGFGSPATAGAPKDGDVRITKFDSSSLLAAHKDASAVQRSRTSINDRATTRIKEHLTEAARAGRLVDERAVHTSSVPDPYAPGADITLVWDGHKAPESMTYAQKDFGAEGTAAAVGIQYGGGDSAQLPRARKSQPKGSSGYGAGFDVKNMYKEDNGCTTTWFVPVYAHDRDHKIVSCYEVWAQDKTVHFIYNRWALWTPAPLKFGGNVYTNDFYVAARPWKGHEYKLVRLNDWAPRSPSRVCDSNQNYTLGGGYGGVTGSVTFPINVCQDYWLDINSSTRKIGIDFDGSRTGQMYMDVAGDYDAVNATVLPIWADYNWVEVRPGCTQACTTEYWVAKDSGW